MLAPRRGLGVWLRYFLLEMRRGSIYVLNRDDPLGPLVPLVPRKAQLLLLRQMIAMADAGKPIRIIVAKARKEGVSTVVEALFAYLGEHIPNFRAITMAHSQAATGAMFLLAKRAYENFPAQRTGRVTTSAIAWPNGSEYIAMTARAEGVSRGDTFQAMHISELAYCQTVAGMDARAVMGAINAVPLHPDTIVVIESTGAGPTGDFYDRCMLAARGQSTFALCFFPWFLDSGYSLDPPSTWSPTDDERALAAAYELNPAQVFFWHTKKMESASSGLGDFEFRREYPATLEDCFSAAEGLVFPGFSDRHVKRVKVGLGWKRYRSIDWGFGSDAFAVLWVAHDAGANPGLIIDPTCENLIREMRGYSFNAKTNKPRDGDDHAIDALRMAVVTFKLTGLVYVYRELYVRNAAVLRPDGCARRIHAMSGWYVPEGSDAELSRAAPGVDGELYEADVAGRENLGLISQFRTWNIPVLGHRKPDSREKSAGEILDGVALVNVLVGGTTRFHKHSDDTYRSLLDAAITKMQSPEPSLLTREEEAAFRAEYAKKSPVHNCEFPQIALP